MIKKIDNNQAGFTLVELLVIVSLSVMLMLASSALFLTFLLGSTKVNRTQLIKNEGEYAMSQIEFLLRNAVQILNNGTGQICETGMEAITIQSLDSGVTTLTKEVDPSDNIDKIASNSGIYLTSGDVTIVNGPFFDCSQSDDKLTQYITIRFTLRKGTPSLDEAKDIVEQEFISGVGIRSF
ncbi:MAG: type II secretion system protein [Candidatus Pacebacteria bacterium]|nr:type II secretion system protein [Candidatus Paceibacterota bacterium]